MSAKEKIQAMESIWDDLCEHADSLVSHPESSLTQWAKPGVCWQDAATSNSQAIARSCNDVQRTPGSHSGLANFLDGTLISPTWHGKVLTEREAALGHGDDQFIDWNIAKRSIKKNFDESPNPIIGQSGFGRRFSLL